MDGQMLNFSFAEFADHYLLKRTLTVLYYVIRLPAATSPDASQSYTANPPQECSRVRAGAKQVAFEQMEEMVWNLEDPWQVSVEQTGANLETRLRKLECERESIKAQRLAQQTAMLHLLNQNGTALDNVRDMLKKVRVQSAAAAGNDLNS